MNHEALSTDARHAGGPVRISDESPAWRSGGGAKGPGHLSLITNQPTMRGRSCDEQLETIREVV